MSTQTDTGTGTGTTEPSIADGRVERAETPAGLRSSGWMATLKRTKQQMKEDSVPLLGAGVAFYALIAIVPGLIAIVSIYGLVADPADVERQISDALAAAPTEVRDLVEQQLTSVVESTSTGLGLAAIFGIAGALWSASSGMKHLMTAVNDAYDETETRGFLKLRGTALLLTIGAIVGVAISVGAIAVVPALLDDTSLGDAAQLAVSILRWPLLGIGLLTALAVLYRYAPDRDEPRWAWVAPGSIVAVVGWILASIAFSFYTSNFGSYGETYGSLGAIIVVMLWLMISATMVIIGAEINAEAEHTTIIDTTVGEKEPLGERDAYVADTLPRPETAGEDESTDDPDDASADRDASAFTVKLQENKHRRR